MGVSCIIRCRDEEQWIGHSIQSFIDFFPDGQIVIVDNNSSDESMEIAKLFDYFDIDFINIDDYTPGKSLNLAVKKCKYDNILILSAHCVLKHVNVEMLLGELKKYPCVFGKQTPFFKGKRITRRYIWSHFNEGRIENMFSKQESRYFLHNAMCAYTKKILNEIPFDERLCGKEDRYWADDLVKSNMKYLYDSEILRCDHHYTGNGSTWKGVG